MTCIVEEEVTDIRLASVTPPRHFIHPSTVKHACLLQSAVSAYLIFFISLVLGKVLSAVGSAQLLMSQKFQQFRGLCEQNLVSMTLSPQNYILP